MKCIHCGMEFETGNFYSNCGAKMDGNSPDQIIGLKENSERSFQLNDQSAGDEQRKGDDIPQRETRNAALNDAAIADADRKDDTVTDNTESEQETDSTVDVGEDTSVSDTTVTEAPVIKELQYGIYLIRDEDGGYRIARVFPAEDNAMAVIYIDQVSVGDRFVTYFTATIPYSDSGIYSAYDSSFNTTASVRFTDLGMDFVVESADAPEQEFLSGEYAAVSLLESPYGYDTPSIGLYESSTDGGSNMADLGLYSGPPSDDGIGYLRITCTNADGQTIAYYDGHLYDNRDGTYNVYSTVDNDDTKLLVEFHGDRMVVTVLRMGLLRYEEIAGEYELNYGYMAP